MRTKKQIKEYYENKLNNLKKECTDIEEELKNLKNSVIKLFIKCESLRVDFDEATCSKIVTVMTNRIDGISLQSRISRDLLHHTYNNAVIHLINQIANDIKV